VYPNLKIVPWIVAALAIYAYVQTPRPVSPSPAASNLERAYQANNAGVAWLERFDYTKATIAFREALALQPSLAMAHFNLALALLYDGKLNDAETEGRAAATAMRGSPAPDYVLGLIAKGQGRGAAAVHAFSRAAQADSQDAAVQILLGQMQLQQGDAVAAAGSLRRALGLEPYSVTAAYNLSVALARSGRTDESRQMLLRFQSLRENGGTTLGAGYLEQGRYAQGLVSTGAEPDLVDRVIPDVRFVDDALSAGRRASPSGAITLFDADGDGDLELAEATDDGLMLWRSTRGRLALNGFPQLSTRGLAPSIVVAGDYDNDGRNDLLVAGQRGVALYRNRGAGAFTTTTTASHLRALSNELPLTAAFVDFDHDGDLDILVGGGVWRNNRDGTFADVTTSSGVDAGHAVAIVPTDYDERRDVDLLVASDRGRLALFRNLRDGTFRDVARDAGLTVTGRLTGIAAGDLNRDGRTDFLVTRADGPAAIALSSAPEKYRIENGPAATIGATAAQTLDYDNDGLTDLLIVSNQRLRLLRSLGDSWQDVTDRALGTIAKDVELPSLAPGRAIAIGDVDSDGDDDIVIRTARGVHVLRNDGGNRRGALTLRLSARVSNRSAAGSRVEMRAGSLHVRRETYAVNPAPAPSDLVIGLGGRTVVDAVRVLWPAGIVQSELQPPLSKPLILTELDRKPSSCPYLFTWNGARFEFLTDFLGGGELGYWLAPGVRSKPDPDEYVRIPADALREKDGRFELRITNELEEVLYLDHVHLEAVAHPVDADVYPNEGLLSPPYPPHALFTVRNVRALAAAYDDTARNAAAVLRAVDRKYPDGFALENIRGYAAPHTLTLRLGTGQNDALLLTGWTDYAFSSDNVAAAQRGLALAPPSLQARDADGAWRTVVTDIGIPVGRPQTLVVDLRQPALRGRGELRIVTNMRIYWDRIVVATVDERPASRRTRLDPASAALRWRGFSADVAPDGREPFAYDYDTVSPRSPWRTMPGEYTAEGDVRAAVSAVDDRFVVMRPGDEIALSFDPRGLATLGPGWTRTFLLYGDGFSKEMDLNSASPDRIDPIPSHLSTVSRFTTVADRDASVSASRGRAGVFTSPSADRGFASSGGARVFRPWRTVTTPLPSIDSLLLDPPRSISPARRSSAR
jgi:tetratricopeptide (TPR) repeat protein